MSTMKRIFWTAGISLQWRHNESVGVSNHRRLLCLLNCWFRLRSKTISKLRVAGLCAGYSPVTGEFPAQKASNPENVSIVVFYGINCALCVVSNFIHFILNFTSKYLWYFFHYKSVFICFSDDDWYLRCVLNYYDTVDDSEIMFFHIAPKLNAFLHIAPSSICISVIYQH